MAAKEFIAWVERKAYNIRQILRLPPLAVLDPILLAKNLTVSVLSPYQIPGVPQQVIDQLLTIDRDSWSAGCLRTPNGLILLVYNPTHPPTRQRATVMEELAHVFLKHKGSKFIGESGTIFRSYNKTEETQAYWVGAAALLPRTVLQYAQDHNVTKDELAKERGVSTHLVGFRENITKIKLRTGAIRIMTHGEG